MQLLYTLRDMSTVNMPCSCTNAAIRRLSNVKLHIVIVVDQEITMRISYIQLTANSHYMNKSITLSEGSECLTCIW